MIPNRSYNFKPSNPQLNLGHPLAQGLVYYVPLGSGSERDLVSGYGISSVSGTTIVPTTRGVVRSFNSASDYVSMKVPPTLKQVHINSQMTFLVWLNLQSSTAFRHPFTMYTSGGTHWLDSSTSDMTNTVVQITNDSPIQMSETLSTPLPVGSWTMIGEKFTKGSNSVGIFNTTTLSGSSFSGAPTLDTVDTIMIGNYEGANGFPGYIDQVAVWARELTLGELTQLYANPYCMLQPSQARWRTSFAPTVVSGFTFQQLSATEQPYPDKTKVVGY